MSSIAIEIPARVAKRKPACNSLSAKITVSLKPQRRNDKLIKREISFFLSALLMLSNAMPLGKISDNMARPTVVWRKVTFLTKRASPSASLSTKSYSVIRTAMRVANSTCLFSYARITSLISANVIPSPLALIASRVV